MEHEIIGDPTFLFTELEKNVQHLASSLDTCNKNDNLLPSTLSSPPKLMFGLHASLQRKPPPKTITPFRSLNPFQTQWLIKGHVTVKKEIHHYTNKNGDGHMFSFDIIDSERNEVCVTCFNSIVDLHYQHI